MCLLGDAGCGKSSFADSLLHQDRSSVPTVGIRVLPTTLDGGIHVSIWDYAGRSSFVPLHLAFLHPDATVFVVFVHAAHAEDEQFRQVSSWLRLVLARCPNTQHPDVFLVASHADQCTLPATSTLWSKVQCEFGTRIALQGPGVFSINTCDAATHQLLLLSLGEAHVHAARIRALPVMSICKVLIRFLESYDAEIRTNPHRFWLSWRDYSRQVQSMVEGLGGMEEQLRAATRSLNHTSHAIFLDYVQNAENLVVHTSYLQSGINAVFDEDDKGSFRRTTSQLPLASAELTRCIPALLSPVIIGLLEQLYICYEFEQMTGPSNSQYRARFYLFPIFLRLPQPPELWSKDETFEHRLSRNIELSDALPEGSFSRIQVHLCRRLGPRAHVGAGHAGSYSLSVWYGGIWCSSNGTQGQLLLQKEGKHICARVRSSVNQVAGVPLMEVM